MKPNLTLRMLGAALATALAAYGQTLNTVHAFGHNELGYEPESGVTIGPGGELYGTTPFGGAYGLGLVYELLPPSSPGGQWTEVVLHSFNSNVGDGAPTLGLLLGPSGTLYGVTGADSAGDDGTVFELMPPASTGARWGEKVLHVFTDSSGNGALPEATPAFGPHGMLYGTTRAGGTGPSGIVYRLAPPDAAGGAWREQDLYDFQGKSGDGSEPAGPLAFGRDGTIFGATEYGGADTLGTVFQLSPPSTPGAGWTEALLHSFAGGSGSALPNGVVLGPGGVLYGAAMGTQEARYCENGAPCGAIFQLTPPGASGEPWTQTILHTFTGAFDGDGSQPNSTPVLGPGGVLYGTTATGGTGSPSLGTIYEMIPPSSPGASWTEVVLYSFTGGADGETPNAVTLGKDGNLYGTTLLGGAHNEGTVFQLVLP
jgi:hypothetical protein